MEVARVRKIEKCRGRSVKTVPNQSCLGVCVFVEGVVAYVGLRQIGCTLEIRVRSFMWMPASYMKCFSCFVLDV